MLTYNNIPAIIAALPDIAKQIIKKAAFDVQAAAGAKAKRQTGFMASSIYVVTQDSTSYGVGVVDGSPGSYLLDQVAAPTDAYTAFIAVGANYGIYVEFGTSRMAAQPFLTPAAEEVAPSFQMAWGKLDEYLAPFGVL